MKFPKPTFDELLLHYKTNPESAHDCPRIYVKDPQPNVNTCALRMSEALVLANRLARSRAEISGLTSAGGNGKRFLLGLYAYKANLCPHGIGRGAADLAYFLQDQWGTPTYSTRENDAQREKFLQDPNVQESALVPPQVSSKRGVIAFIKIDGYDGQGHIDLWNESAAVGHAYWRCRKVSFWKLD
jgi:hypothetical protein